MSQFESNKVRNNERNRSTQGFTLIELLVVIAIIAILAAILFPVFAQAREKARQATCASNLKQQVLATLSYSQDYDEMMPTGYWDGTPAVYWYQIILPYVSGKNANPALINFCPSSTTPTNMAYSMNQRVGGNNDDTVYPYYAAVSSAAMTHPSDTILYADADQIPNYGKGPATTFYDCPGSVNGGPWNAFQAPTTIGAWNSIDNDTNVDGTSAGQVRYRHNGGAEFAFCDGHVKWWNRGTVTIYNWQVGGDVPDTIGGGGGAPANQYGPYR